MEATDLIHLSHSSSSCCASAIAPELDHGDFLAIDDLLDFPIVDVDSAIAAEGAADPANFATNSCCISYAASSSSSNSNENTSSASSSSAIAAANVAAGPQLPLLDKQHHLHHQHPPPPFASDELCVPSDDLANLEWLSDFVEASFSGGSCGGIEANYTLPGPYVDCHPVAAQPELRGSCDGGCNWAELSGGGGDELSSVFMANPALVGQRHSSSPISVLESSAYKSPSSLSSSTTTSSSKGRLEFDDQLDNIQALMFDDDISVVEFPSSPSTAPARSRSKRGRSGACFWNTRILSHEASESLLQQQQHRQQENSAAIAATTDRELFSSFYDDDNDDGEDEEDEEYENSNGGGDGCDDSTDDDEEYYGDGDEEYEKMMKKKRHYGGSSARGGYSHYEKRRQSMKRKRAVAGEGDWRRKGMKECKKEREDRDEGAPRKRARWAAAADMTARKCMHCATQKTPQWRAGPMGPKTLCNACGVRYKSGRLCPEYRPAASPTFVDTMHSNSHRKVMEMRRQKGFLLPPPSAAAASTSPALPLHLAAHRRRHSSAAASSLFSSSGSPPPYSSAAPATVSPVLSQPHNNGSFISSSTCTAESQLHRRSTTSAGLENHNSSGGCGGSSSASRSHEGGPADGWQRRIMGAEEEAYKTAGGSWSEATNIGSTRKDGTVDGEGPPEQIHDRDSVC